MIRPVIISLLATLRTSLGTPVALQLEILALRHQLQVLERTRPHRVRLTRADRLLWSWLSRLWREWRSAIGIVRPETASRGIGKDSGCCGRGRIDTVRADPPFLLESAP